MIRQLRVEFRKFFARDIVRLFGLIVVGMIVLSTIGSFITTVPMTQAQEKEVDGNIRRLRRDLEPQLRECQEPRTDDLRRILADAEARGQPIDPQIQEQFEEQFLRERSRRECLRQYRPRGDGFIDHRFHFAGSFLFGLEQLTLPMAVLALVLGATLIGAEWSSGAITTLLTWEPRRILLFAGKMIALGLSVATAFLLVTALMSVAMLPASFLRGTFVGLDRWWLEEAIDLGWRGVSVTVLAGFLSFAVASVFRSTVVAIGALFGYLVIVERILTAVTQDLGSWLISNNVLVAVFPPGTGRGIEGRSPEEAIGLLAAYVGGLLLISGFLFWRRDAAGSG